MLSPRPDARARRGGLAGQPPCEKPWLGVLFKLYADQSESIRSEAVFGQEFTQKINDGNLIRPDGTLSSPFGLKLWRTPVVDSLHHLRGHGEVEMGG